MLTFDQVYAELGRIARQRAVVKAAQLRDDVKAKLLAQLDEQVAELERQIVGTVPPVQPGGSSQPQGSSPAQKPR